MPYTGSIQPCPAIWAAEWRKEETDGHTAIRDAANRTLLIAYLMLGMWLEKQTGPDDTGLAYRVIGVERHTLGSLLGYALSHQKWTEAQVMAQLLDQYWSARGLDAEVDAWADRARAATEAPDGSPPQLDTPAGALWLFFTGAQAKREIRRGLLGQAERHYLEIMAALQPMRSRPDGKRRIGIASHQLGRVAEERGRWDEAEKWFRKALAIEEEIGSRQHILGAYQELGRVAHERGRLDEAEEWYRKALAIREEVGDYQGMASTYHQLGMVARERGRLGEAEEWYRTSLAIRTQASDRPEMAKSFHELGNIALLGGRLAEAEEWYRKSLAIVEEVRDRTGMANTYDMLGVVAQRRGGLREAEDWYRNSLALKEETGNRPGMAVAYARLGLLAREQGELREALDWTVRCVASFDEFPHPATGTAPQDLARLTEHLGMAALEDAWRRVAEDELPGDIRGYVQEFLRRDSELRAGGGGGRADDRTATYTAVRASAGDGGRNGA